MITLREILDLEVVRRGEPALLAGESRLDTAVRWVHAAELTDMGRLLRGGELLLSTGIALPDSAGGLTAYVAELAGARVAGLAIELGRRYSGSLPPALVAAAARHALPLVEFRREVRFVEITEVVHARIIDELLIERAAATLALGRVLAWHAESLERQAHRTLLSALISQADGEPGDAAARAGALGVPVTGRQLVALVVRLGAPSRGATARDSSSPGAPGPDAAGSDAAGLDSAGLDSAGPGASAPVLPAAEALAAVLRGGSVPALVGALDDVRIGALLSLPARASADASLAGLVAPTVARFSGVIGVGPAVSALADLGAAFREAREVADVAARHPGPLRLPYYRLADLRLRGLLHALRDDPRLRAFAEHEAGPLAAYDASHGTTLVSDLLAFLDAGGNKALAAQRAHLARPTFYQRLRLIERVLGVSLADAESRAALHVALLALAE